MCSDPTPCQALCWVLARMLSGWPALPPAPKLLCASAQLSFLPFTPHRPHPSIFLSSFLPFPIHPVIKPILKCSVLSITSGDGHFHTHPEMAFVLHSCLTFSNPREPHLTREGPGPPLSPFIPVACPPYFALRYMLPCIKLTCECILGICVWIDMHSYVYIHLHIIV